MKETQCFISFYFREAIAVVAAIRHRHHSIILLLNNCKESLVLNC